MNTSIIIHSLFSEFSYEQMQLIMDLAKQYEGKFRVVSTGIQIYDISKEDKKAIIAALPEDLRQVTHKSVNSVTSCRGVDGCAHGLMETIPLATKIDREFFGVPMPNKIRIGISGCPRSCAESMIKDIGLIGLPDGYALVVGGTSGASPRKGETILKGLSIEEAYEKISFLLQWYKDNALEKEKFERILQRLGNPFQEA